ncbi:hypothetical protein PsorP6_004877 [Peronosclerospora sorghi]|uniref:Uncharacterized protein n=1 Tax=Peronosclerospora sorghi TaxID=230839 RepID=A0ACC0W3Y6_9STRA|nr:hypothetical protein PsorP6_004877 [Peronosclerospora sorghi]
MGLSSTLSAEVPSLDSTSLAEERKKQKLATKEKAKKEKEKEKNDAVAAGAPTELGGKSGVEDVTDVPASVSDEHAAIAADIFAMHQQPGLDDSMQQYSQQLQKEDHMEHNEVTPVGGDEIDYVPDGTQALLNAAFHSTQDIMKEVVSRQSQQMQGQYQMHQQHLQQPTYQKLYRNQQQMQMHHLTPPQQQYHQGFEPEDAASCITNTSSGGIPMGFGAYSYGATAGYYGDQFGNYGVPQDTNAFGSAGYANSAMIQPYNGMNGMRLPPLGSLQMGNDPTLQHQHQQQQNSGVYTGGYGDYWR